jgi:glycosyltransferase involved in cell wall biosynthesis
VCHLGFPPPPGELEWSFRFGPDAVIACYEGQARDVAAMLEPLELKRRVVAIPNGVNLRAFTPDSQSEPRDWRFNARHVVAIVGHLSEVKGYPIFLDAAARISSVLDDCVFLAIGRDTLGQGYGDHLERRARETGLTDRVKFLGWQSNVAEIVRQADVVVSPSLGEGFPLAVLEAMACARPVVATTVGGVPEAVVHGETGYLVPPGEVEPFVEATLRLLRDRAAAERMGLEGRRRVETRFSLTRFVNGVQSLYDDLLKNGSRL